MVNACSVPQCKSKQKTRSGILLHSFPINKQTRTGWVRALNGKKAYKCSKICSIHFTDADYIVRKGKRYLKINAVPSRNFPNANEKGDTEDLKQVEPSPETTKTVTITESEQKDHPVLLSETDIQEIPPLRSQPPLIIKAPKIKTNNATTQIEKKLGCERGMQTDSQRVPTETMAYDELSADDFYFFTGLKLPNFQELVEYLDVDSKSTKFTKHMSNYDQLVLTLIKLCHKFEFKVLAKMYGIDRYAVHDIFVLWINIMFDQFKKSNLWAIREKDDVVYTAIVHCREIPCQSFNYDFHNILNSDKQNRQTFKYLIATDEQGMVIFCSKQLFGGSITDRQVIIQSGILSKLRKGDKVLFKYDLNIGDVMKSNGIIFHQVSDCSDVNIGQAYLNRAAAMTKKFGILKGIFPAILMPYAAVIVYVTSVLVNFMNENDTGILK